MILTIDPGVSTGWAEFTYADGGKGTLFACGAGDPRRREVQAYPQTIIIERPQVYRTAQSRGVDPNDLITLAIQVGQYKEFFEALGRNVHLVLPRDWKGQVPKKVHHPRILSKLTPGELKIVNHQLQYLFSEKAKGDMMDAVGLGLFWLGRCRVGCT